MVKRILFICSGNICRSPMAKLLLEDIASRDPALSAAGIEVDSAGTDVVLDTAPAEAIEVMREHGLGLAGHRSKPVDSELVLWADLVLTMERRQGEAIVSRFPQAADKTYVLPEYAGETGEVADPYGHGLETYRECAAQLRSLANKAARKALSPE